MKVVNGLYPSRPEFMIAGTLFCWHAEHNEFAQRDVPSNRICMEGIWPEHYSWAQFFYDSRTNNRYTGRFPDGQVPAHVQLIILPNIPYFESQGRPVRDYHQKRHQAEQEKIGKELQKQNRKRKRGRGV